ncbi:DEAD-box ATP-dependent RNA helicase 35, partial [Durusdinium trenchii]
ATRARPSPFIGARKVRPLVGAAELAALQVEDEVVVASSPLAPTQVEQEEGLRVLADLSDSELGKLCRGQVPHVQRELERQLVARAQQRKKVYEEAAQQGRRKAAHFRRRVELKLLKEVGDALAAGGLGVRVLNLELEIKDEPGEDLGVDLCPSLPPGSFLSRSAQMRQDNDG